MLTVETNIKVKSVEYIKKTCRYEPYPAGYVHRSSGVLFPDEMMCYCDKIYRIKKAVLMDIHGSNITYVLDQIERWHWHEDWIEPYVRKIELPEELFKL